MRDLFAPGEISLRLYLLFALAVRLPAVFFCRGYDFLDHQFQYVDPAYHLAFGASWWRPHDYVQGLRSWVYPGILAGVFKAIAWTGIVDPAAMMTAARFVHALFSLIPVAAFWMLIVRWKGWKGERPLLLFFACNPLAVYSAVQPTGPTFAVGLSVASVLLFHGSGRLPPFLSGLLLGLAFSCRFQDAFFGPVLFVSGLLARRWVAAAFFGLGLSITVAMQGLVDLFTWGRFLHSPLRYVEWNVFEGAASRYGTEPFWYYAAVVAGVLVLVPPFLRSGIRALAEGSRGLPLLLAASVFHIGLHNLVERKAIRFIIPALILLLVVYGSALFQRGAAESKRRALHRRVFVGAHLVVLSLGSFWYPQRGPVEAALALNRRDDFTDRLVIVDGMEDALGGYFYLGRKTLRVDRVKREDLTGWLAGQKVEAPLYLMVVRRPLELGRIPEGFTLEQVGASNDWPDWKRNTRRFLYRARRDVVQPGAA